MKYIKHFTFLIMVSVLFANCSKHKRTEAKSQKAPNQLNWNTGIEKKSKGFAQFTNSNTKKEKVNAPAKRLGKKASGNNDDLVKDDLFIDPDLISLDLGEETASKTKKNVMKKKQLKRRAHRVKKDPRPFKQNVKPHNFKLPKTQDLKQRLQERPSPSKTPNFNKRAKEFLEEEENMD